ncbi:MAG: redoxin domain-containing protein [Planctomycetota bacterium]
MNSIRSSLRALSVLLLLYGVLPTACSPSPTDRIVLPDLDGRLVEPLDAGSGEAVLLLFLGTECPIAQAYSPEIASIADEFSGRVATRIVLVDRDLSVETARSFARDYNLPQPILLDPHHRLVERLSATVTPEAILLNADLEPVYVGRIDDRFVSLGRSRPAPRQRDLRDAIEAVSSGRLPPRARAPAVGCRIE